MALEGENRSVSITHSLLLPLALSNIANVPELDGFVRTPGGEQLAVLAESHGPDRMRVALESVDLLASARVPQFHQVVRGPRRQDFAIRRKSDRANLPSMPQTDGPQARDGA